MFAFSILAFLFGTVALYTSFAFFFFFGDLRPSIIFLLVAVLLHGTAGWLWHRGRLENLAELAPEQIHVPASSTNWRGVMRPASISLGVALVLVLSVLG